MRNLRISIILMALLLVIPIWTGPASADIFIQDITADETSIKVDHQVQITVSVKNTGASDQYKTIYFYLDHEPLEYYDVKVPAGGTNDTTITWCPGDGDIGTHTITAQISLDEAEIDIKVVGPDIYVTDLTAEPMIVTMFEGLNVAATVKNMEAHDINNIDVDLYINDRLETKRTISCDAGDTKTVGFPLQTNENRWHAGTNDVTVMVFDKEASISITVLGKARIEPMSIYVDRENVRAGEVVKVTVNIHNYGSADAENLTLRLYLDDDLVKTHNIELIRQGAIERVVINWRVPDDAPAGEHELSAYIDEQENQYRVDTYIYISNPLGGTPVHMYIIGFLLAGVVMIGVLMFFITRGPSGKDKGSKTRRKPSEDDDDIVVLED